LNMSDFKEAALINANMATLTSKLVKVYESFFIRESVKEKFVKDYTDILKNPF